MQEYLHGECVALGMLPFTSPAIREQVKNVLLKYQLPVNVPDLNCDFISLIRHDKKANASGVNVVLVNEIGSFEFRFMDFSELGKVIKEAYIQ
jgi:3-dehydroquinate synthase